MLDRRSLFLGTAAAISASSLATARELDSADFGLKPSAPEDQTAKLQRAVETAAGSRTPLRLAAGTYRVGEVRLPPNTQLLGVRGQTRLAFQGGAHCLVSSRADQISIENIVIDGGGRPLGERRGLITLSQGRNVRVENCEITGSTRNGLVLEGIEGVVEANTISTAGEAGILALDSRNLMISRNTIRGIANNGILVWRSAPGDDGTIVESNRIEDIAARAGGSGENGNGINVFRAGNVMVRGNRIRNCAFSAVRANGASNISVTGNTCTSAGEVALYAEFSFEGALFANNVIDGAAIGISSTNFKEGGRMAVISGNIIRNLINRRPAGTDPNDGAGIGIAVEADAAVSGNVIEGAPTAGVWAGWGQFLRDVAVTGNVIRFSPIGIAVSVVPGAGAALIADNLVQGASKGAILGMEWKRPVTGDLARDGVGRFAQLSVSGNRIR
ncbi:MAG: TIGR03808 family TAT-translocated repetitive protein [Alphaproteobacteria bacterium]